MMKPISKKNFREALIESLCLKSQSRMMEAKEQQDGGEERTGENEENESDAAHDTGASAADQVAEDDSDGPSCSAAATAPKRPQSATEVAGLPSLHRTN